MSSWLPPTVARKGKAASRALDRGGLPPLEGVKGVDLKKEQGPLSMFEKTTPWGKQSAQRLGGEPGASLQGTQGKDFSPSLPHPPPEAPGGWMDSQPQEKE